MMTATLDDANTVVDQYLSVLDPDHYSFDYRVHAKRTVYTVKKDGVFVAQVVVEPNIISGLLSVVLWDRVTDDPELRREWMVYAQTVFPYIEGRLSAESQSAETNVSNGAQLMNIIADNLGGTVTYTRNDQGQTISTGGTVNPGYISVLGQGYAAIIPVGSETTDMLSAHDVMSKDNGRQAKPWRSTGQPPKTKAEKVAAIQAWDNLSELDRPLLAEWLETNFGSNPDGSLAVAESTFHGWRNLKKAVVKS
jgi:hypothetical protein